MATITLFTSKVCPHCPAARAVAEAVAAETDSRLEILDIEENMIRALQSQIASVPSILIDGEVFCRARVPTRDELLGYIKEKLCQQSD